MAETTERTVAVLENNSLFAAAVFSDQGLYATSLPRKSREEAIKAVGGSGLPERNDEYAMKILGLVFDVFYGRQVDLSPISFDFSGLTEKQCNILKATMEIEYGHTMTYGELAKKAGLPGAARFVGNVMASNRFAPLIPCHRVISGNGLGGYGLGLDQKVALLSREGAL